MARNCLRQVLGANTKLLCFVSLCVVVNTWINVSIQPERWTTGESEDQSSGPLQVISRLFPSVAVLCLTFFVLDLIAALGLLLACYLG